MDIYNYKKDDLYDEEIIKKLKPKLERFNIKCYFEFVGYSQYKIFCDDEDWEIVQLLIYEVVNMDPFESMLNVNLSEPDIKNEKIEVKPVEEKYEKLKNPKRAGRKKKNRNKQAIVRFTEEEWESFKEILEKSQMDQGEFIRLCVLQKEIKVVEKETTIESIETLISTKSELGKYIGMMKQVITFCKENKFDKKSISYLAKCINAAEQTRNKIDKEVEKVWQC